MMTGVRTSSISFSFRSGGSRLTAVTVTVSRNPAAAIRLYGRMYESSRQKVSVLRMQFGHTVEPGRRARPQVRQYSTRRMGAASSPAVSPAAGCTRAASTTWGTAENL